MPSEPRTLAEVFLQGIDKFPRPDRFVQKSGGVWNPISSEEFGRRVRACAAALASIGIRRGTASRSSLTTASSGRSPTTPAS
jgi:long-subunit acyl-CoA synthetase (AMP-forming)